MTDEVCFISLGFNCHPKTYIRNSNELVQESLPFDFNFSFEPDNLIYILKNLHEKGEYSMNFTQINEIIAGGDNLRVIEESGSHILHFFTLHDLIDSDTTYPCDITNIRPEKIEEVKDLFDKRYKRFLHLLGNDYFNNIVFIREEFVYKTDFCEKKIEELLNILCELTNPNKKLYFIHINHVFSNEICYNFTKVTSKINRVNIFKYNVNPDPYVLGIDSDCITYQSIFNDVKQFISYP